MLIEQAVQARRERAKVEKFLVRPVADSAAGAEFDVASASGYRYRVVLRSFSERENSCTCPDFATNNLGTCKHIERVLLKAGARKSRIVARRRQAAEIYLDPRGEPRVRVRVPERAPDGLRALLGEHFGAEGVFAREHYRDFERLAASLRRLDEPVVVREEVFEHVGKVLDEERARREEPRLRSAAEAGRLSVPGLKVPLYPFQQVGAVFAALRGRAMIADDMGLGKTIEAIAAAKVMQERRGVREVLIVCPASVKWQWRREIGRFSDASAVVIDGPRARRAALYGGPEFFKIANYEAILRDRDLLAGRPLDLVILDEAQRIKNWTTKTARVIKRLRRKYAIVLTGTPLENRLEELYSIVQFLDDRLLGPMWEFERDHIVRNDKGGITGYKGLATIRAKMAPMMIRRKKEEVLKELPKRVDNTFEVPITPEQKAVHDEYLQYAAMIASKPHLTRLDVERLMAHLTIARMVCDTTYLYDKKTNYAPKLKEFAEVAREICVDRRKKVVIFSQWERMLEKIEEVLRPLGIRWVRFTGSIPPRRRAEYVDRFREDDGLKAFLSTDAGGVGLNLQAASHVVIMEPPWNPAVLEQRIGRVHRMGQRETVNVVHFVTRGSIEQRLVELMATKRALAMAALEGGADEVVFKGPGRQRLLDEIRKLTGVRPQAPFAPPTPHAPSPAAPVRAALEAAGVPAAAAIQSWLDRAVRVDPATGQARLEIPLPPPEQVAAIVQAAAPLVAALAQAFGRR